MYTSFTIRKPFDAHVHLRRGAMLKAVLPYTAARFGRGIVMPNTDPPIDSVEAAAAYRDEILAVLATHPTDETPPREESPRSGASFEPLMTLYLTTKLSPAEVEKGAEGDGCKIFAIKSYPYGATTNSQWGYRSILEAHDVLAAMERTEMPLLLHGEVHLNDADEEEDPYDGERLFFADTLPRLLEKYPALKISLEHVSTAEAADFVEKNGREGQFVATITPHHLMYDRTQAFSGGYRALLHCKPLIKRREDKERLRELAAKGLPFIHAGTDTAPHPESKKFSSCCAFGVFNAPAAVEMYAQVFDEMGASDKLENFLSMNGPRFFGFEPDTATVTLEKKDWQITEPVVTEEGVKVWPVGHAQHGLGNETFHWKISK